MNENTLIGAEAVEAHKPILEEANNHVNLGGWIENMTHPRNVAFGYEAGIIQTDLKTPDFIKE